ncbi:MAG TPA: RNA polymerase sigma factor [Chthoniobacterales bacterium]
MHGQADDDSLAQLAASGDETAFTMLFKRHYRMIHAFAHRICLDASLAEDVAQETFVKAARELASRGFQGTFKPWLYRIAKNGAIDLIRRRLRESRHLQFESSERPANFDTTDPGHEKLTSALARLGPELRAAIALVYFDQLNHAEAAASLGCAETTVSWRIFQAKRKLRKWLTSKELPS